MKRAIYARLFALLILLSSGAGQTSAQTRASKPPSLEAKVDAYVEPFLEIKGFNGAILIASKGQVLLRKSYGMANYELDAPNTPQTKFHIASISKTFTAAAILVLEERGLLSVHDPLSKYIPDYPEGEKITIHHLLSHTSGIPNVNNFLDYNNKSKFPQTLTSVIEMFKNKPLRTQPGARYEYSNSNYNLLAFIVEKVSGKSYGEFLKENIFDPLGMNATGHDGYAGRIIKNRASGYSPVGADGLENTPYLDWTIKTGNGSLYSTVEDLYKWDRALYTEKILKKNSLNKMFKPHADDSVGYGWFVGKRLNRNVVTMSGRSPGFQGEIHRYVDDDVCVIVLSNNYSGAASFMINDLGAIVFAEPYETLAINAKLTIDPKVMDMYLGRYQSGSDFFAPGATITAEKQDGHLVLRWSMGASSWLAPITEAKFYDRMFGANVTFVKDDKGKISHLIYRFSGMDYRVNKAQIE
jgi:CubicO group peptidase (beta-lactamase class C family)